MGLHTGTPLLTEDGYVGLDLHPTARIAAAGHGGQVLVSAATAALLEPRDGPLQGAVLCDLGEHRFKDLAAPERVFQLGDVDFPLLRSLYRTNLPVTATPYWMPGDDSRLRVGAPAEGRNGEAVPRRHARHFLKRTEPVNELLDAREWTPRAMPLAPEIENVRAAVGWALAAGEREVAIRLAWASDTVRITTLEQARWLECAVRMEGDVEPSLLAHAHRRAGFRWYVLGELAKSQRLLERALQMFRKLGDTLGEASALRSLGITLLAVGETANGMASLDESLELTRDLDPQEHYRSIHALGEAERDWRARKRGEQLLTPAADLARDHGDTHIAAAARHGLGDYALDRRDWRAAEAHSVDDAIEYALAID